MTSQAKIDPVIKTFSPYSVPESPDNKVYLNISSKLLTMPDSNSDVKVKLLSSMLHKTDHRCKIQNIKGLLKA